MAEVERETREEEECRVVPALALLPQPKPTLREGDREIE